MKKALFILPFLLCSTYALAMGKQPSCPECPKCPDPVACPVPIPCPPVVVCPAEKVCPPAVVCPTCPTLPAKFKYTINTLSFKYDATKTYKMEVVAGTVKIYENNLLVLTKLPDKTEQI